MKVEHLMTKDTKSCRAEDSLCRAAQLMWDHDCGTVPVVNADGHVVGMITDRDVCMAAYTRGTELAKLLVSEAMSREVFTCRPETALTDAQTLIRSKRVRRLPVVDADGRLVGILSLNDILRQVARDRSRIGIDEVLSTAAAVCEPRIKLAERTETNGQKHVESPRTKRNQPVFDPFGGRRL